MRRRWAALPLTTALAGAFLGCPSLGEIGVGPGDAGAEASPPSDVAPKDTHTADRAGEANACTANPASDPKNCGRCGHDCKGGACESGVCRPYPIVTGTQGPWGVAVGNGVLYFTTFFLSVETCSVDDCMHTLSQVTSSQAVPRGITMDTTNVYWANQGFPYDGGYAGSIATCGLAGCPTGTATVLASTEQRPIDLAVDTRAVYWTDDNGGVVRSCSIGGCGNMPSTLATDPTLLSGVAIDATSIYWAEATLGNIVKCPLSGCPTFAPFASGQANPAKIDIANGTVFWSTDGAIMSCATSGCGGAPTVFANGQPSAFAVAHDATNLYWTLYEPDGKVLSCPLSGCTAPTLLADMQNLPSTVAVDDTGVYWANSGGSTVMRLIK